jgi:hypothetical protein
MAEDMGTVCCRGKCQTKAKDLEEIIRRAGGHSIYSFYSLVLGVFLFLAAVMLGGRNEPITSVLGVVGIGLLFGGLIRILRRKN